MKSATVFIDCGIIVQNGNFRQSMPPSHFKIIGVMGRRNLNHTRTELHIHIGIPDNRNCPVHNGQHHLSADQMLIPLILRVNSHTGIAQHGFRTGRGKFYKFLRTDCAVCFNQRIFDMPEVPLLFFVFHLRIGNGCIADGTPVNDPAALIDPAFFMHPAEHLGDRLVAALIHGKTFSVPVTGGTQLL